MTVNEQKAKGAATSLGLRATAAAFIPLVRENQNVATTQDPTTPKQRSGRKGSHSERTTYNIKRSKDTGLAEPLTTAAEPVDKDHLTSTATECGFCIKHNHTFACCLNLTSSSPCSLCADLHAILTQKTAIQQNEIAALRTHITQLEQETPKEKHKRLCTEKNTRIEQLKAEVERFQKEAQHMQRDIKKGEEKLARLRIEMHKYQPEKKEEPKWEFYVKEGKQRRGKKK